MTDARKTARTYYTDDRVAATRTRADREAWAAAVRQEAVANADGYLDRGFDTLWGLVTGQRLPRAADIGDGTQCERWQSGPEPWTITNGETVLPTNDFGTYRESGRDDRGFFDPALADDSLLDNIRASERGPWWGVDDSHGWIDDAGVLAASGTAMVPVAYYNHWHIWYELRDAVVALRDAYLFTGKVRFARGGLVLLDRIADAYPDLDIAAYDPDRFWNGHGGTGQGRMVGSIWETNLVRQFVAAYDAFFPATDDPELLSFLAAKAEAYQELPPKDSAEAIRANIEGRIIREVLPAVRAAQVRGNLGMHQAALAMSAVVADDLDGYTAEALDFLFRTGDLVADGEPWGSRGPDDGTNREWRLTGGDLNRALVERLDRDGYADESAPNYNGIVQRQLLRVADILAVGEVGPDLHDNPKLRRAVRAHYPLLCLDCYMPSIGDSGLVGNPDPKFDAETAARSFQTFGDPMLAQAAYCLNGHSVEEIRGDPFDADKRALVERIAEVVEHSGSYDPGHTLLPAYGFAALRQGSRKMSGSADSVICDRRRAVTLFFGRNHTETGTSHSHHDALSLGLYAHGRALAPDLGYPESTGDFPHRQHFTRATVSHNTAVVDGENQRPHVVGVPRHFFGNEEFALVDVAAPQVYPTTDTYRRTTATVRVDETDSYVIDWFRVAGGEEHVYSFHGPGGTVETTGLSFARRAGTYAGSDVERPPRDERDVYDEVVGSGFNRLDAIAEDRTPPSRFSVEWNAEDTWNVGSEDVCLRATVLTDCNAVALADGHPPQKDGNPTKLRYLLCRRQGENLNSTFTTILEPYAAERRVRSVKRVPIRALDSEPAAATAVRVSLDTGRVDYLARAIDPTATYVVADVFAFRGQIARYSVDDDTPVSATLIEGTELRELDAEESLCDRPVRHLLVGQVVDFTRELDSKNEIIIRPKRCGDPEAVVGERLHVETEGNENGVYEVIGVEERGDCLSFDVGDATTVAGFTDPENPDDCYRYSIHEGDRVVVPAVECWRADDTGI